MMNSVLEKAFIDSILSMARKIVEREERLEPFLFVHVNEQEAGMLPLRLPKSGQEKQAYFSRLGAEFRTADKLIQEALLLVETWIAPAPEAPAAFIGRPSQHPNRQEAVIAVGRDAANSRSTIVVQPFTRATDHRPVWGSLSLASYNKPVEQGNQAVGLLDYLFDANQRR